MPRRMRTGLIVGGLITALAISGALLMSHNTPCNSATATAREAGRQTMRGITSRCYGPPEVLQLEQVAKPAAADDRVLVKVRAASVNPLDWHMTRGEPFVMRLAAGIGAPDSTASGVDFAGTVESVGKNVTRFKPGDDVFGGRDGAFADYVSVAEHGAIVLKPEALSFEEAAAVPIAAVTALQALTREGRLESGQNVLINGASGGVGTFAVQIAKALGARVTGVCSTRNLSLVSSLGADRVIDYSREDFTTGADRYDLIIDTVGTHPLSDYRRVMNPHATLVLVGSQDKGRWLGPLASSLGTFLYAPFVPQRFVFFLADLDQANLETVRALLQAGKVKPVIDRHYPLSEVPAALRYLELGHARGKVVIDVN